MNISSSDLIKEIKVFVRKDFLTREDINLAREYNSARFLKDPVFERLGQLISDFDKKKSAEDKIRNDKYFDEMRKACR